MRSILLLILAVFVVGLAFGIYWVMLGSDESVAPNVANRATAQLAPATLPTTSPTAIGPGDKAYYLRYDQKTGQLSSRLRAERYLPQADGRWQLTKPEAEFFMEGGRVVRIVGQTGVVTMQETIAKGKDELGGRMNQSPNSGTLYDVTLTLLPAIGKAPELTMTMPNASFNNESSLIYTEGYTENGKTVSGEMVPVTVRGEQYEFDGRGLRLRYNELNRSLEELRIVHGNRLLIRHPGQFMRGRNLTGAAPAPEKGALLPESTPGADFAWLPTSPLAGIILAAADDTAANEAARSARARRRAPTPPPVVQETPKDKEPPVYRATFQQDVEIFQGGRKIAVAKDMHVDYLTEAKGELSMIGPSATQPAAAPSATTRPSRPTMRPTAGRASRSDRPRAPHASSAPGASPTTTQSDPKSASADTMDEPIEIRWKGPLTITPVSGDRPDRIAPGESIIKLIGTPARPVDITRDHEQGTSRIHCATLTYWSVDGGLLLEESPGISVELSDSRGTHIVTRMLVFSEKDATALLTGKSHATLPLAGMDASANPTTKPDNALAQKPDPKKDLMNVDWTDRCTLYLQGDALDAMVMDRIDLWGDVVVDHPQLKTRSDAMQLRFAQQTEAEKAAQPENRSTPPLEQVDAAGSVRCVVVGTGGETDIRKINCDSLKLLTARGDQGRLYARNIIAMGHVDATDPDRQLQAEYVHVTLGQPTTKPTTRPTTAAEPALATSATTAPPTTRPAGKGHDVMPGELQNLVAHDNVRVKTTDGKTAKANQLTIDVKDGVLSATLHGENAEVSNGKNTVSGPIIHMVPDREQFVVTGEGEMNGLVQKAGDNTARPVNVKWTKSLRADGKENLLEAFGSVVATTTDAGGAVTTTTGDRVRIVTAPRPTTQPATTAPMAQKATTRPSEFELIGDREVRSIALEDRAVVESVMKDAADQVLRAFHVDSASIHYDREARKLTIPQAGRMLFQDYRTPATQPTAQAAAKDPFGIRGATAFKWDQSLVYDEVASRVTLLGNVVIGRVIKPGEAEDPLQLFGDKVVADLEPAPGSTTRPADPGDLSAKLQFKRVTGQGHIRITSKTLDVTAEIIEFDPAKHLLSLRGTERNPATEWDGHGMKTATFDEMIWDTENAKVLYCTGLSVISRSASRIGQSAEEQKLFAK